MDEPVSRRTVLTGLTVAAASRVALGAESASAGAGPAGGGQAATPSAASRPGAPSAYGFESQLWVRINDRTFCCYRAGRAQKYPYFYPLFGPTTGLPMTEESGVPWPHHRSLFFACDKVNGGNYWQEGLDRGQIISRGPRFDVGGGDAVVITDVCDWRSPQGQDIIEDRRSYRIAAPDAPTRILDCRIELTPRIDVRVDKTNHSLFSIRAARDLAPDGGGRLMNSTGLTGGDKGAFGERAAWCGFEGQRFGRVESIVLMDHPKNPWFPSRWFTRDYGFASPTSLWWLEEGKPWELPAGRTLTLRYRVAILGRGMDREELDRIFNDFASV